MTKYNNSKIVKTDSGMEVSLPSFPYPHAFPETMKYDYGFATNFELFTQGYSNYMPIRYKLNDTEDYKSAWISNSFYDNLISSIEGE